MKAIKPLAYSTLLALICLTQSGCWIGGGSSSSTTPNSEDTGTIDIQVPNSFPYDQAETISVNLSITPTGGVIPVNNTGLGFSNLTLNTHPSSALSLLTILPFSTCSAITASSTATSCSFVVINNNENGQSTLDSSSYYVTGQFNGQTVMSNIAQPGDQPSPTPYTPPSGTFWTITINNVSSSNKYLFVMGQNLQATGQPYGVLTFDTHNYGTFHTYSATTAYGSDTNSITLIPGLNIIHIPYGVWAGRAYISTAQMSGLDLNSSGGITTPDPGNSSDPNYTTIYDDFEFTYAPDVVTGVPHAVINQTAVDYISTPMCLTGTSNYQPIQQAGFCNVTRDNLLNPVAAALSNADAVLGGSQWRSLILQSGSTILRIMSPGSSDALSPPNPSSIQSFASYLNPYISALATQYTAANSLQVQSPDTTQNLTGNIQDLDGTYTYVFSDNGGANQQMPLTTSNLLVGAAPSADAGLVTAYQMVSAAFMAGQLPPSNLPSGAITENYLRTQTATFYQSNSISSASAYQYSVYSQALNAIQANGIYTYAYDDVLGKSSTMTETLSSASDAPDPITVTITY